MSLGGRVIGERRELPTSAKRTLLTYLSETDALAQLLASEIMKRS
jgi:hypothetical protein